MKQLIIFPFLGSSCVCFDLMWERCWKNWLQFLHDTEQVKKKKKKSLMSRSTTPFLCCFPPLPNASSVVSVIKRSVTQTDIHFNALCSKPICKLPTCWIQPCSRCSDRVSYWKYTSVHSKTWRHPTFFQQGGYFNKWIIQSVVQVQQKQEAKYCKMKKQTNIQKTL